MKKKDLKVKQEQDRRNFLFDSYGKLEEAIYIYNDMKSNQRLLMMPNLIMTWI